MYKKYGETLFLTNEFKEYCSNAIRQKDIAELLLCIAYEAKDYGDSIEPNAVTSVIEDLFSNLENEVLTNGWLLEFLINILFLVIKMII